MARLRDNDGNFCHQINVYNLDGEYGIGWTTNTNREFYFDLEDYDKIKDYCWYESYYKNTQYSRLLANDLINHKIIYFHHLLGFRFYDHKDRNTFNNRKNNFRLATQQENTRNRSVSKNNTSGVTGVSFDNYHQIWKAYITVDNNRINIGSYSNKDDAIRARLVYEELYFGEFSSQKDMLEQYNIFPTDNRQEYFVRQTASNNNSGITGVGWNKKTNKWNKQ